MTYYSPEQVQALIKLPKIILFEKLLLTLEMVQEREEKIQELLNYMRMMDRDCKFWRRELKCVAR